MNPLEVIFTAEGAKGRVGRAIFRELRRRDFSKSPVKKRNKMGIFINEKKRSGRVPVSVAEMAQLLNISTMAVLKRIWRGRLKATLIGHSYLIYPDEVRRVLRETEQLRKALLRRQ